MLIRKTELETNMQHLNCFFFKRKWVQHTPDTQAQCAHSVANRNRKYGPAHRQKQSKHALELLQWTAASWRLDRSPQILLAGTEQANISIFCLEDVHPHSNKTEVPQASPSHRLPPLSWAALTCSPSLLSPQKKALHGTVGESPWTLFCYTLSSTRARQ